MPTKQQTEDYIKEQNIFLRDNIDDYLIGEIVFDLDNAECKITNKAFSSIEVYIEAKDKHKSYEERKGINHKEWFYIKDFNKRFKKSK